MPQQMRPLALALRALLAPVLIALLFLAAPRILDGAPAAHAAAGDLLVTVTEPEPQVSCCGIGVEFDGTKVLYTHYGDNRILFTDLTGANLGNLPLKNPDLSPYTGGCCNAIALDVTDGFLYGGSWNSTDLSKVDMTTGVVTLVKANAIPFVFGFIDGLAWDPRDNTFWMSDDDNCSVRHLDSTGNDLGGFDGCAVTGLANSGLSVGLDGTLFYGTDGNGQIYSLDTTTNPPTNLGAFASPGGRDEDMSCGPKYTKPDGSTVETLLSQDAYNDSFTVIEMAPGKCVSAAQPVTCPDCDETQVTVDSNVTVDFNPVLKGKPPTCDDGVIHDLCNYFSWDTSGPTPDTWKAIFDVGKHKLVIKDNVTVTTQTVPLAGTNRAAPGIVIKGSCEIVIEGDIDKNGKPARVVVTSQNLKAGDILIQFQGNVTIDGQVRDEVQGTNNKPGKITIASCCGDITTGPQSRIETIGIDAGGSDINILTCCARGYDGTGGDIVINGLVRAVHKSGTTPTINIVAFVGAVTIDGTNDLGDVPGSSLRRTSGVLVETLNATDGGDINIQAQDTVTVYGNRVLFTNRTNYGAVAIKTNNTNGLGGNGAMKVVSVGGSILASDRAFDFANRFNHTSNTFITLLAHGDVSLTVTALKNAGAADNTKAVVTSQGGTGGQGGTNTLRAYGLTGNVIIGAKAQVLANAPGGVNGKNLLISCAGVLNSGTVNPADAFTGDDSGTCGQPAPAPLFTSCEQFGVIFVHDGDGRGGF